MHLYSPDRPQTAGQRPALLGWRCAVPQIMVMPGENPDTVWITTHLPVLAFNNFGFFTREWPAEQLRGLFDTYKLSPEDTLRDVFGWTDRAPSAIVPVSRHRPAPIVDPQWSEIESLI